METWSFEPAGETNGRYKAGALQETGARNGWSTAARVPNFELALRKDQLDRLEVINEVPGFRNLCRQAPSNSEPIWRHGCSRPNDQGVLEFAASAKLGATKDDENAKAWTVPNNSDHDWAIEGNWSSRWNGGADPTIPGDAANKWKRGQAEVKAVGDRLYFLFDWDHGARRGLIDAHREGTRLVGKYINLTDPKVVRPWVGLIVSNQRIDGRWTGGRLDFRR